MQAGSKAAAAAEIITCMVPCFAVPLSLQAAAAIQAAEVLSAFP